MRAFISVILLLAWSLPARAETVENKYDLLARTLTPFFQVFSQEGSTQRTALRLSGTVEQMTDLPAALEKSTVTIAVQYPDKVRIEAPIVGERVALGRNGQELWVSPGAGISRLLGGLPKAKGERKGELGPLALPFPDKQLVFLPTLFRIKDLGYTDFAGKECRVLDLTLMPELAKQAPGWVTRIWINADAVPMRISLARKGWNAVFRIDSVAFPRQLPADVSLPTESEAADVLRLDASRFLQLVDAAFGMSAK